MINFMNNYKGGRAYAVYEANLLRGSAMIGTGKIFDMVVPMGIYKRFMKKKNWIIKCL